MEPVLELAPDEAMAFIRAKFEPYAGQYDLEA
jgi:hypothetical protein